MILTNQPVENLSGKGENVDFAFSPFPLMFTTISACVFILSHSYTMTLFDAPGKQAF